MSPSQFNTTVDDNGDDVIYRDCASLTDHKVGCEAAMSDSGDSADACFCTGDGCNAAGKNMIDRFPISIAALVAIIVVIGNFN